MRFRGRASGVLNLSCAACKEKSKERGAAISPRGDAANLSAEISKAKASWFAAVPVAYAGCSGQFCGLGGEGATKVLVATTTHYGDQGHLLRRLKWPITAAEVVALAAEVIERAPAAEIMVAAIKGAGDQGTIITAAVCQQGT